jgi:hypothetical protein
MSEPPQSPTRILLAALAALLAGAGAVAVVVILALDVL